MGITMAAAHFPAISFLRPIVKSEMSLPARESL
jgi:hypothetical protein